MSFWLCITCALNRFKALICDVQIVITSVAVLNIAKIIYRVILDCRVLCAQGLTAIDFQTFTAIGLILSSASARRFELSLRIIEIPIIQECIFLRPAVTPGKERSLADKKGLSRLSTQRHRART